MVIYDCRTYITLKGQCHCKGSGLSLRWIVSVKLLNLDLLLVLVCVVEHNHLHCALKLSWILEVHSEAALTKLIIGVLSGLVKLSVKLLELSSWWCLGTLLSDFVGRTRCLYLEVHLNVLLFLALRFKNTFVSHVLLVLYTLFFGFEFVLLLFKEFFVILFCLFIGFNVSCRLATSCFSLTCLSSGLFSYIL